MRWRMYDGDESRLYAWGMTLAAAAFVALVGGAVSCDAIKAGSHELACDDACGGHVKRVTADECICK